MSCLQDAGIPMAMHGSRVNVCSSAGTPQKFGHSVLCTFFFSNECRFVSNYHHILQCLNIITVSGLHQNCIKKIIINRFSQEKLLVQNIMRLGLTDSVIK